MINTYQLVEEFFYTQQDPESCSYSGYELNGSALIIEYKSYGKYQKDSYDFMDYITFLFNKLKNEKL